MVYYFIIINIISFFLYGIDKYLAIKNYYRVSEYTLFVFAFFGGSVGSILGMIMFHHKIKKRRFWILNTFFLIFYLLIWRNI